MTSGSRFLRFFGFALLAAVLSIPVSQTGSAEDPSSAAGSTAAAAKAAEPKPDEAVIETDEATAAASHTVGDLKAEIENVKGNLKLDSLADGDLEGLRDRTDDVRRKAEELRDATSVRFAGVDARLKRLGTPPAPGQPPEPDVTASERKTVNASLTQIARPIKDADAIAVEAMDLQGRISLRRRVMFAKRLLERVQMPVSPAFWGEVGAKADDGYRKLAFMAQVWWHTIFAEREFYAACLFAAGLWLGTSALAFWGIARFRTWNGPEAPPLWRKTASAAWVVLFTALPPAATAAGFYFALKAFGLLDVNSERIFLALLAAVSVVALVNALAATLLAPRKPQWRVFVASDKVAGRIRLLCVAMAAVFGADLIMSALNEVLAAPLVLSIAQNAAASIAFALLALALVLLPSHSVDVDGEADLRWIRFLRLPFALVAFAILALALTGYVALARFLSAQIAVTATILILLYLLLIAIEAFTESIKDENATLGRWLNAGFGFEEQRRAQIALPVSLTLKAIALAVALPLIMLQLGFDWGSISDILRQGFFGSIFGTGISLAALVKAAAVFLLIYTIARLFQEWLDARVLGKAGMSASARDSVKTGFGYAGVIFAGIAAFSSAGVNFSNLALVAGALSVGIGLGLQGVVNNFVSGLILLAERPIRVGDWVEVGSDEGIVRRISVRSTEVETFDRANIVIPNAMLISDKVKNWTRHNDTGRVTIPVSVAAGSDAEDVRDILLRVARENVEVLAMPAPIVYFENFTATSLDFKLYAYLLNINRSFAVRTDLRIAILKAFREADIQIPHTQLDIFIREFHGTAIELAKRIADGGLQQRNGARVGEPQKH